MRIRMICPAPPRSLYGNRVTALRWMRILRQLGHRVTIAQEYDAEAADLLIALHASKSAEGALMFHVEHPHRPLLIALTGTDLYRDIPRDPRARQALEAADRMVALQPLAKEELEPRLRRKVRVIYQSAPRTVRPPRPSASFFDVCVVGHLREVKDPFRTAEASRRLPGESRVRVLHAGEAMEPGFAERARAEQAENPRYRWLGEMPQWRVRRLIARSRLLVLSSRMEGGGNVISEALVDGVPVLASHIPGSIGLLGEDYPGYFPLGDTAALTNLLLQAETDPRFYAKLKRWCKRLASRFQPGLEREAWRKLLREIEPRG